MRTELIPVVHVAGPYSSHRLFEWTMACALLGMSIVLALPGDSLDRTALRPLVESGISEPALAAFFGIVGSLRVYALLSNGYLNNGVVKPSGATIRAWCSVMGAIIWAEFALTLVIDAFYSPSVSMFMPVMAALSVSEFLSSGRARRDAVERRRPKSDLEKALEDFQRHA